MVRRDVGQHPIGADVWPSSVSSAALPREEWNDLQRAAQRVVTELADELEHASSYLFAAPLYNWGSPRAAWDHAIGWMQHLLETVWGLEVTTVEVSLTLAPAREHMAHLRPDAAAELARARADATDAGKILAAV